MRFRGGRQSVCVSTRWGRPKWRRPGSGTRSGATTLFRHDGYYDLRITGGIMGDYYYDYLALMTVDHPAGTEIFRR